MFQASCSRWLRPLALKEKPPDNKTLTPPERTQRFVLHRSMFRQFFPPGYKTLNFIEKKNPNCH